MKLKTSRVLKLFISENCPKCPPAKKLAESLKSKIPIEIYDIQQPEGLAEAAYYQILSTPTFVLVEDDEIKKIWTTILDENELLKEVS